MTKTAGELVLIPIATTIAESVTHPIDYVKTRRQVDGKGGSSFLQVARATYASGGVAAFYPSLVPAAMRHWVYGTARVGLYERVRSKEDGVEAKMAASFLTGGFAQLLSSPFDLVKVKIQANALRGAKGYTGVRHVLRDVYAREGFFGFYHGWAPNVLRACTSTMGELAAYDYGKQFLLVRLGLEDNVVTHACSSLHSGFWASIFCTPADVVKSRMMAAASNAVPMRVVVMQIARREGLATFYKGFFENWARFAPFQLTFWCSYEQIRLLAGYDSFQ